MARQKGKGSGPGLRQRKGTQNTTTDSTQITSPASNNCNGKATQKKVDYSSRADSDDEETPWVGYALLASVTAVAYLPTYSNDYVWDDHIFAEAPQVIKPAGLADIWLKPGTIAAEAHYWPVVYTSFWIDYRLFGRSPTMSHAINVLLHAAVSCLLHRLLRRMGQSKHAAWLTAIVFALHPVHVESVAWAIERKDTLSGVFYLSSLLVHPSINGIASACGVAEPSSEDNGRTNKRRTASMYAVSLLLYALGMLTKSIVCSLPVILLLIPWFVRGKVRRTEVVRSIPFFVVGVIIAVLDMINMIGVDYSDFGYTFIQRIAIASRAVCFYLWKIVWPTNLVMMYPLWSLRQDTALWVACVVVISAALTGLFALRKRWGRGPLTALLFFGLTVGPCLCLIDYSYMQYSFVADRYQYLAMAGPVAFLSSMAATLIEGRGAKDRRVTPIMIMIGLLVATMGVQTYQQSLAYRDDETFYGYVTEHNQNGFHGWHHLGNYYLKQERLGDAARCLKEAARIVEERKDDLHPMTYKLQATVTYVNYGLVVANLGHSEEGMELLRKAVTLSPRSTQGLNEMGNILSRAKRHEEAIGYYRRAVEVDPEYAFGWANIGGELCRLGRWDEAVEPLQRAIEISPGKQSYKPRKNLATAFTARGKHELAINQYGHILSQYPDDKEILGRLEDSVQAIERFKKKKEKERMDSEKAGMKGV